MRMTPSSCFPNSLVAVLALTLILLNFVWLYATQSRAIKAPCGYIVDSWSAGIKSVSKNGTNETSVPLPFIPVQDYQQVRGSGLKEVPFPIPIPNDTVLLGEDLGEVDGLQKRYLTIGIASVWRKEEYLYRTLDSILKETGGQHSEEVFIFLLLADADTDMRKRRKKDLERRYPLAIDRGTLRVLQPPSLLYPSIDFSMIRRTYNDSVGRVQWRTKQVLDFAFLFWYTYSRQPSHYYLILEDDILSARHFVTAIRDFVELHSRRQWVALQFSGFLGIGQLIKCSDMDKLVSFLLLFYREHPVDVLFNHWVQLMAPQKPPKDCPYRRVPGLFQHIGIHSTLANKTQPLRDTTFSLVKRRFSHVNPEADIVTSIKQYKAFVASLAYSSAPGMFWGVPQGGDTFDIILTEPKILSRIVVITGASMTKRKIRDKLMFGQLQVSPRFEHMSSPKRAECLNFIPVKDFSNGEVDIKDLDNQFSDGIQCIRIVVGDKQRTWISISEIAVFELEEEHANVNDITISEKPSDAKLDYVLAKENNSSKTSYNLIQLDAVKTPEKKTTEILNKSQGKYSKTVGNKNSSPVAFSLDLSRKGA